MSSISHSTLEGTYYVLGDYLFCYFLFIERSVQSGDDTNTNDNKRISKQLGTLIDFHTIKVTKDDEMIDDKRFFNL